MFTRPPDRAVPDAPVRFIPTDAARSGPEPGIALCLSGGGYRAMLFHLGALWRLADAGWLSKLDRVSSVSGGSITAAVLAHNWGKLDFDDAGIAHGFAHAIADPVHRLATRTIDAPSILGGLFSFGTVTDWLISAYRRHLFGSATLQDLPDSPRFVFNATNVQTGVLWRFSKPYMGDYRVGLAMRPRVPLAVAVAASSAYPPVLSPLKLHVAPGDFTPQSGHDLQLDPFTAEVVLTDGGVYDNLGLETVWKRYQTVLISDAGGTLDPDPYPRRDWPRHALRAISIVHDQVTSLRKRQAIHAFIDSKDLHNGTYWGIASHVADYHLADAFPAAENHVAELAATPTRLKRLKRKRQQRLVNWGFAICDTALRKHVDPSLPRPAAPPYSEVSIY